MSNSVYFHITITYIFCFPWQGRLNQPKNWIVPSQIFHIKVRYIKISTDPNPSTLEHIAGIVRRDETFHNTSFHIFHSENSGEVYIASYKCINI